MIGKYVFPATVNDAWKETFTIIHCGTTGYDGIAYQYNVADEDVSWCRNLQALAALKVATALI